MTQQRSELRARAARDRAEIAASLASLAAPVHVVDRGLSALQWIRARPYVAIAGAAAITLIARRFGGARLAQVALGGWQIGRLVTRLLLPSGGRS